MMTKIMQKTKNQSVQTDPRPKLIPWENSSKFCNTQMHATKEYLETPQHIADYFPLFSKELLALDPTTCKHPILSNINPTVLFQPSEKSNEFPKSTSIRGVFKFNSTLFLQSRKILHDSQFSHSSGIYFGPISKDSLFSEKYHFIYLISISFNQTYLNTK